MANDARISPVFRMACGTAEEPLQLPWLDALQAVFIAVNRVIGDDLTIALDYRTDPLDPRVVASDWPPGRSHTKAAVAAHVANAGISRRARGHCSRSMV